jgi:hypothetical protein
VRLIGAVLLEANDDWQLQYRYMQIQGMAELNATSSPRRACARLVAGRSGAPLPTEIPPPPGTLTGTYRIGWVPPLPPKAPFRSLSSAVFSAGWELRQF